MSTTPTPTRAQTTFLKHLGDNPAGPLAAVSELAREPLPTSPQKKTRRRWVSSAGREGRTRLYNCSYATRIPRFTIFSNRFTRYPVDHEHHPSPPRRAVQPALHPHPRPCRRGENPRAHLGRTTAQPEKGLR